MSTPESEGRFGRAFHGGGNAATDRVIKATVSRNVDLLWPFGAWVALWPFGLACYLLWGRSSGLPWVMILQTVVFVGLTWLVGFLAHGRRNRRPLDVGHSVLTMAGAGTFIVSATIVAPWAHPLVDLWGFLGLAVAGSWSLRAVMERRDKEAHDAGRPSRRAAARELMLAHGLDVDAKVVEATKDRVDVAIDTTDSPDSLLPKDLVDHADQIAASCGVPPGAVTVLPDDNHAGKGLMRIVTHDILRGPALPWPGPSAPGGTPFDPVVQGVYQDGLIASKVVADETGVRHQVSAGMSGSGKSNGSVVEHCELITRREVFPIVVDTVKGTQTFGPLAAALGIFIIDTPTARRLIKRLPRVIAGRTSYLGARNLRAWKPGCGLSFLLIQLEEYSELDVSERDVQAMAKALRSAGGRLNLSLQRPQHTQIDVNTRAQLGMSQTYGCNDSFGDEMIPDEITEAGADPRRWRDEWPGCNYLIGKGIPNRRKATPLRDYEITVEQMLAHAAEWGPRMQELDPVTAKLLGDVWTQRVPPLEVVRRANDAALNIDAPAAATRRPDAAATAAAEDDEPDWKDEDMDDEWPTDEELGVVTPDPAPGMAVDENAPLPTTGVDVQFGDRAGEPRGPMTEVETAEARRLVADRIDGWEREGREEVRPTDFADWYSTEPRVRSRGWFRKELQRLVDVGRLEFDDEDKLYRIVADPNLAAAR
jgi:hypothetical protein